MAGGQITEIIAQFAGYLHIQDYMAKARLDYDDLLVGRLQQDEVEVAAQHDASLSELENLFSLPLRAPYALAADTEEISHKPLRLELTDHVMLVSAVDMDHMPFHLRFPVSVPINVQIKPTVVVQYGEGGEALVVNAAQLNRLIDNDIALPAGIEYFHQFGEPGAIADLIAVADQQIPTELKLVGLGSDSLIEQFKSQHDGWRDDDDFNGNEIDAGLYIDGLLQSEDAEVPTAPASEIDLPDEGTQAQIALAGGNDTLNAAVIVDVNPALGTLIVKGDYFRTDAIVQVNAYRDDDMLAGGASASMAGGGNDAYNVANFIDTDPGIGSFAGSAVFAGLTWRVDIHDGDFYDIRAISQTNWIRDNDVSLQTSSESHFQLVLGKNEQVNLAEVVSLAQAYDLVIVLGDYHEINLIYQKNILLDADYLEAIGGNGELHAGHNFLLNDATIEQFGNSQHQELSESLEDLIEQLNAGVTNLDPSMATGLPNFNDGSFDVLIVKGDVFDINVIEQVNIVEDADSASMFSEDGVAQVASTGGNFLTNAAAIITTDPAADIYVGGEVYEDEVLVQAEIIEDDDDVVYGDPDALAYELVAFTQDGSNGEHWSEDNSGHGSHSDGDVMGSILT